MSSITRFPVLAFVSAACIVVVTGCNQLPPQRGEHVQSVSSDKLEQKNPVEVVVAPVQNATGDDTVPIVALREAFQAGLVRRRYSPLALEYVDRKVVDATYTPGSLQESAVLLVEIESWDTSHFETRAALLVKARARLVDAENPANGELWSGTIDHRFDLEGEREKYTSRDAFVRYACGCVADELLAALPARSAGPGN